MTINTPSVIRHYLNEQHLRSATLASIFRSLGGSKSDSAIKLSLGKMETNGDIRVTRGPGEPKWAASVLVTLLNADERAAQRKSMEAQQQREATHAQGVTKAHQLTDKYSTPINYLGEGLADGPYPTGSLFSLKVELSYLTEAQVTRIMEALKEVTPKD